MPHRGVTMSIRTAPCRRPRTVCLPRLDLLEDRRVPCITPPPRGAPITPTPVPDPHPPAAAPPAAARDEAATQETANPTPTTDTQEGARATQTRTTPTTAEPQAAAADSFVVQQTAKPAPTTDTQNT